MLLLNKKILLTAFLSFCCSGVQAQPVTLFYYNIDNATAGEHPSYGIDFDSRKPLIKEHMNTVLQGLSDEQKKNSFFFVSEARGYRLAKESEGGDEYKRVKIDTIDFVSNALDEIYNDHSVEVHPYNNTILPFSTIVAKPNALDGWEINGETTLLPLVKDYNRDKNCYREMPVITLKKTDKKEYVTIIVIHPNISHQDRNACMELVAKKITALNEKYAHSRNIHHAVVLGDTNMFANGEGVLDKIAMNQETSLTGAGLTELTGKAQITGIEGCPDQKATYSFIAAPHDVNPAVFELASRGYTEELQELVGSDVGIDTLNIWKEGGTTQELKDLSIDQKVSFYDKILKSQKELRYPTTSRLDRGYGTKGIRLISANYHIYPNPSVTDGLAGYSPELIRPFADKARAANVPAFPSDHTLLKICFDTVDVDADNMEVSVTKAEEL